MSNKLIFGILFGILAIGISSNQLAFAESDTPLFSCGANLNLEGGTYTLQNNVNVTNIGSCFTISANDVTLNGDGFTISQSNENQECTGTGLFFGVTFFDPFSGAIVDNLTFDGLDIGVAAISSDNNLIVNNKFLNNCIAGVLLSTILQGADGSSGNTVSDNEFRNNGIQSLGEKGQILVIEKSNGNFILRNDIQDGPDQGIYIQNSDSNIIDDNFFFDHQGDVIQIAARDNGSSENNAIINNEIIQFGNNDAIDIEDAHFNTITNNILDGGGICGDGAD